MKCRVTKKQIHARKGGIRTIEWLQGIGIYTSRALRRAGYDTLAKLAKASLDNLAVIKVGKHRISLGRKKAGKLKRQAARAK